MILGSDICPAGICVNLSAACCHWDGIKAEETRNWRNKVQFYRLFYKVINQIFWGKKTINHL